MIWRRHKGDANLILEYFSHPEFPLASLIHRVLEWAQRRAREIAGDLKKAVRLYAGEPALKVVPQVDFRGMGFLALEADPERHTVFFARALDDDLPEPSLPPGYAIRSLRSPDELDRYARLYGFTDVSADYRRVQLSNDEYVQSVISDPAGEFAAYCEHSISRAEWERGSERVGWIDYVGTREEERGKGLGEAMLLDALHSLRDLGAEAAMLVTISDNLPAQRLYRKAGFGPVAGAADRRYWIEIPARRFQSDVQVVSAG
jgi:mycothiol synthase